MQPCKYKYLDALLSIVQNKKDEKILNIKKWCNGAIKQKTSRNYGEMSRRSQFERLKSCSVENIFSILHTSDH